MMISILTSFVDRTYLCRYYCDNVYRKIKNLDFDEGERTWTLRRHIETVAILVCVLVPASFIHGFKDVGNFAGIFTCFMTIGLPAFCLIAKFRQSRKQRKCSAFNSSYEDLDNESEHAENRADSSSGIRNLILGIIILSAFIFVVMCGLISAAYIIIVA